MKKSDRDRALDFEEIRKAKKRRKRRKIALIATGAVLVLMVIVAVLVLQVSQVTDSGRDFWGNFNASHSLNAVSQQQD